MGGQPVSMKKFTRCAVRAVCLLLLTVFIVSPVAADDADRLAGYLPDSINAVAIVRVADTLKSPRAVRENWAAMADANFLQGTGGIPSWVETLVVGFLVRQSTAEEVWATGVAKVPEDITIASLAEQAGVPVEQMSGFPVMRGRGNSFVLGFDPGILGIRRPGVRQETARWAGNVAQQRTGQISSFLKEAVSEPGQLVYAIDLNHALEPAVVKAHLETGIGSTLTPDKRERLVRLIAGVKDVTLAIQIEEQVTARVVFDFSEEAGDLADYVKPIFIDILHQLGAAIDDFEEGAISTDGTLTTLTSPFSDDSLGRVLSLITTSPQSTPPAPAPASTTATSTPSTSTPGLPPGLRENRAYFQAIDKMLNDLERSSRRSSNPSRVALWFDNFARRIDELPVDGVDQELINFGGSVSSKLRAMSRSLQGQILAVNAEQGTLTYDTQFNPGWASVGLWGGVGFGQPSFQVSSNLQQVRERQAAAVNAGSEQRIQIWGMLTEERAAIQRTMQQKYGPEFLRSARR